MSRLNLNNFGKKLKFSKRSDNKKIITEKELFIETLDLFYDVWNRSNRVYDSYKVNLLEYEEPFFRIIENCFFLKYEPWKAEIVFWYVFAREDEDGNISPLILSIEGKEEEIIIKTASDLWELFKRVDNEENKNNKSDK